MRTLLTANMIFALVMPVIDVFVAAYVMRNSHAVKLVVAYQLAVYTGIPAAFLLNGVLLRRAGAERLYAAGMLLIGLSMAAMMSSGSLGFSGVVLWGLSMGAAYGLFAANRALLALTSTEDGNRNYYYGLEMFFYTATSVLVPLAVGWLIGCAPAYGWFGGESNRAYRAVAAAVCGLSVMAVLVLRRGRFEKHRLGRFLHLRFHPLWYRMLWLGGLKGLAQGYIATAPAMLILLLVGQEGALGLVQACGGLLSAFVLYGVGRMAAPEHRLRVFAAGLTLFFLGGVVNALLFNAAGVLILVGCLLLAKPLLDAAYFPIQFRVTEIIAGMEGRDAYAYIFNHECAEYAGRVVGCGVFLLLAIEASDVAALKYALPAIGAVHLISLAVAGPLLRRVAGPAASVAASAD